VLLSLNSLSIVLMQFLFAIVGHYHCSMTLRIIAQQLFALRFGWVPDSNSVIASCEELRLYEQAKTCK
jgi:hypothetical protein